MYKSGDQALFVYFVRSETDQELALFSGQKVTIISANANAVKRTYTIEFANGTRAEVSEEELHDYEGEESEGP